MEPDADHAELPRGIGATHRVNKRLALIAASAFVIAAVVLGVVLSQPSGPPPLGDPATWGTGLQCTPGRSLANGFYPLENHSAEAVTVTSVRLIGGRGQKMTSPAYLVPIQHTTLIGLDYWPPTSPMWKLRMAAIGGKIPARATVNLVFRQTRTSNHPRSATAQIVYSAGGISYTLTEPFRVLVAVQCSERSVTTIRPTTHT
ncbi:MAG TPA: hypothetical protein VLM11_21925 [Streptosporangiaceae bacterium]|nr:hypothetical protein [Streptosporangiaceae bacterium]